MGTETSQMGRARPDVESPSPIRSPHALQPIDECIRAHAGRCPSSWARERVMAFLGRARDRIRAKWVGLYESPWAELVTAAGTVTGSAIISISGGLADRWWLTIIGSAIIVLGLLPTWSRSTALTEAFALINCWIRPSRPDFLGVDLREQVIHP